MAWQEVRFVRVQAWGEDVGVVAPGRSRAYEFEYEPSWRRRGIELAPSLMPVGDRRATCSFPGLPLATFQGLPPMLADAVPDKFGNSLIAAALAREGLQPGAINALDRMAYVGTRSMGALTFVPDQGPRHEPTVVELTEVVEAARRAVEGDLADEQGKTQALHQLIMVGTSAGGARAKAVIAWNRQTNEMRAGNLDNPPGFEQFLLKFDGLGADQQLGATRDYGRTEMAYYLMATSAGIDMAESHLLEEGGRAHFVTRRFDRPGTDGDRLHLQSLCALEAIDFNETGTNEYASLMVAAESLAPGHREQLFRRIAFNVLASNNDDHSKNFSFLMDRSGQWSISPAYDVTFAYDPSNRWTRQHLMGVEGNFDLPSWSDLLRFADRFSVPGAKQILDEVANAVSQWAGFATQVGLSVDRQREVQSRLAEIEIAAGGRGVRR